MSYACDLRQWFTWCHQNHLPPFAVRRGHLELLWRKECGDIDLVIPAFLARRRTILVAAWRLSRNPYWARRSGPDSRSPAAMSTARATRGGRGMRASLDPLPSTVTGSMAAFDGEVFDVDPARL